MAPGKMRDYITDLPSVCVDYCRYCDGLTRGTPAPEKIRYVLEVGRSAHHCQNPRTAWGIWVHRKLVANGTAYRPMFIVTTYLVLAQF
jgi:hypothetical protein